MPDIIFDSKTFFVVSIVGKVAEAVGEFTFSVAQAPKSLDKLHFHSYDTQLSDFDVGSDTSSMY